MPDRFESTNRLCDEYPVPVIRMDGCGTAFRYMAAINKHLANLRAQAPLAAELGEHPFSITFRDLPEPKPARNQQKELFP